MKALRLAEEAEVGAAAEVAEVGVEEEALALLPR
jgi:hypothetical protein